MPCEVCEVFLPHTPMASVAAAEKVDLVQGNQSSEIDLVLKVSGKYKADYR